MREQVNQKYIIVVFMTRVAIFQDYKFACKTLVKFTRVKISLVSRFAQNAAFVSPCSYFYAG